MMEKLAEILTVAKQPALKQHIMQQCKLPTHAFAIYTQRLIDCGLLRASPPLNLRLTGNPGKQRMIYQTTDKGREFLKRYSDLLSLMETSLKYTPKLKIYGSSNIDKRKTT